jgi:hypothetical protein
MVKKNIKIFCLTGRIMDCYNDGVECVICFIYHILDILEAGSDHSHGSQNTNQGVQRIIQEINEIKTSNKTFLSSIRLHYHGSCHECVMRKIKQPQTSIDLLIHTFKIIHGDHIDLSSNHYDDAELFRYADVVIKSFSKKYACDLIDLFLMALKTRSDDSLAIFYKMAISYGRDDIKESINMRMLDILIERSRDLA